LNIEDIITTCLRAEPLKSLMRSGWAIATGVPSSESVAAHSWGVAFISTLLSEWLREEGQTIDKDKLLTMALLHDLPEALLSDIPHSAGEYGGDLLTDAKAQAEDSAFESLTASIDTAGRLKDAWIEFNALVTLESRLVASADLVDMLMHASRLEAAGMSADLFEQFFASGKKRLEQLDIKPALQVFEALLAAHRGRLKKSAHR
jgi:putative hydrolase of HD superfamily